MDENDDTRLNFQGHIKQKLDIFSNEIKQRDVQWPCALHELENDYTSLNFSNKQIIYLQNA